VFSAKGRSINFKAWGSAPGIHGPKAISAEGAIQFRRKFDPINHATLDPPD